MRIAFLNPEIRALCEDAEIAVKQYGAAMAEELKLKIAALMSATTISDIPQDDHTVVENKPNTLYQIGMAGNLQLICRADHTKAFPKTKLGQVDWQNVNYIQITQIIVPHGR